MDGLEYLWSVLIGVLLLVIIPFAIREVSSMTISRETPPASASLDARFTAEAQTYYDKFFEKQIKQELGLESRKE